MTPVVAPSLKEIIQAKERIAGLVLRTPLVRLNIDDAPAEIYLKLENLQPIGSFKLRGAGNVSTKLKERRVTYQIPLTTQLLFMHIFKIAQISPAVPPAIPPANNMMIVPSKLKTGGLPFEMAMIRITNRPPSPSNIKPKPVAKQ